ncbi:MAG: HAD hydrolase-like protein [Candidatus Bathyarchaeia archaeon]|nr:HAD hydrolase-like protein [Candidatus Bathyarchaeia archaeon]
MKCATKLDLEPEHCVIMEDSVFGLRAAKEAGMKCVALLSGAASKSELEQKQPDIMVASLEQKEVILKFIFFS